MPHILVVDDEQDIRQLVALILESAGYRVSQATRGPEALDPSKDPEAKLPAALTGEGAKP